MSTEKNIGEFLKNKRNSGIVIFILTIPVLWNLASSSSGCSYSKSKSGDFFCESNENWEIKRAIFHEQETKQISHGDNSNFVSTKGFWWQVNYEPNFTCAFEKRIGGKGNAGNWICDPHRIRKISEENDEKCLVLSFGAA